MGLGKKKGDLFSREELQLCREIRADFGFSMWFIAKWLLWTTWKFCWGWVLLHLQLRDGLHYNIYTWRGYLFPYSKIHTPWFGSANIWWCKFPGSRETLTRRRWAYGRGKFPFHSPIKTALAKSLAFLAKLSLLRWKELWDLRTRSSNFTSSDQEFCPAFSVLRLHFLTSSVVLGFFPWAYTETQQLMLHVSRSSISPLVFLPFIYQPQFQV